MKQLLQQWDRRCKNKLIFKTTCTPMQTCPSWGHHINLVMMIRWLNSPVSSSLWRLNKRSRLRAVSLFSVVRRAKRETSKWPHAWLRPPSFHASRDFAASRLPRACIALTKSEEKERLFAVHKRSEDTFFTGLASIWRNIFTNSSEKTTCLSLCLLCLFKFQTLTCRNFWIFYFMSRLALYKCVVNVCIQR